MVLITFSPIEYYHFQLVYLSHSTYILLIFYSRGKRTKLAVDFEFAYPFTEGIEDCSTQNIYLHGRGKEFVKFFSSCQMMVHLFPSV
jgi:hypothetical protein